MIHHEAPEGVGVVSNEYTPLGHRKGRSQNEDNLSPFPRGISACHQKLVITSLPLVHTARRYHRMDGSVRLSDCPKEVGNHHPKSWSNSVI